ncbi:MAG: hypothetical protein ACI8PW_000997 [Methylophilaceae bacterium]|jgi:hypothetical protein
MTQNDIHKDDTPATETTASGIYLGGGRYQEAKGEVKFWLLRITTRTDGSDTVETISSPISPHGFATEPNNHNRAAVFTKIDPDAAVFDMEKFQAIKTIVANPGQLFYGHGAFSTHGKLLYTTKKNIENNKGYIGIRDAKTSDYLDDFPSYGHHPHDCSLRDNGKTLVVINRGSNTAIGELGNLSYIDIETQKLITQFKIKDGRFNAGHVEIDESGNALVSALRRDLSENYLGTIHISKAKKRLKRFSSPFKIINKITGKALSELIVAKYHLLLVTHQAANMVTYWNLDSLKCRKVLKLSFPRGLALNSDQSEFIISFGSNVAVKRYQTTSLKEVENSLIENTGISRSHLVNWLAFQKG